MEVPVNLERVLIEAGKDLAFYQALVSDPARALDERGYRLRATEKAMLSAMPQPALQKMIEQLRPEKLTKSRFAKQVATAVAGTLLFSSASCASGDSAGIRPADASANSAAGTGGNGGVDGSFSANAGSAGGGVAPDWPMDASTEGSDTTPTGTGGQPAWQPDTGPVPLADAGGSGPDWPADASYDGSADRDADQPTWEPDSATVTRGISPDLPGDAANDSNDSENQGGN
jgi:hypothetical protein